MKYGERNGRKAVGEFSLLDKIGLALASAAGIIVATFVDLTQSDETSALFIFNKWLTDFTETIGVGALPLYGVILLLMVIGAASVLYLQPVTFRGAFVQGFGVLAALMTVAPKDMGDPLPGMDQDLPVLELEQPADAGVIESDISFRPAEARGSFMPVAAAAMAQSNGYNIRIKIVFPDGLDQDIQTMIRRGTLRGRLHNESTGATYNLFRNSGANLVLRDDTIMLETRLPGSAPTASLVARVEADGYRIIEDRFSAKRGANEMWEIRMVPGATPLMIQRLTRPYRF